MYSKAALILLLLLAPHAFASDPILGTWEYDGFIYQDQRYPNPNPKLHVLFTFNSDHTSRLYWKREDESGFCERKGTWEIQEQILQQSTTWINPQNESSCMTDPDMQPGRMTENRISISGAELQLFMKLGDYDFIYLLKLQNDSN